MILDLRLMQYTIDQDWVCFYRSHNKHGNRDSKLEQGFIGLLLKRDFHTKTAKCNIYNRFLLCFDSL